MGNGKEFETSWPNFGEWWVLFHPRVRIDSYIFVLKTLENKKTSAQLEGTEMSMIYRNGGSLRLEGAVSGGMASGSFEGDEDYIKQMKELHAYLDMVRNMIRPGCPEEALKLALNSMSSLFSALNFMSSMPRPHASL